MIRKRRQEERVKKKQELTEEEKAFINTLTDRMVDGITATFEEKFHGRIKEGIRRLPKHKKEQLKNYIRRELLSSNTLHALAALKFLERTELLSDFLLDLLTLQESDKPEMREAVKAIIRKNPNGMRGLYERLEENEKERVRAGIKTFLRGEDKQIKKKAIELVKELHVQKEHLFELMVIKYRDEELREAAEEALKSTMKSPEELYKELTPKTKARIIAQITKEWKELMRGRSDLNLPAVIRELGVERRFLSHLFLLSFSPEKKGSVGEGAKSLLETYTGGHSSEKIFNAFSKKDQRGVVELTEELLDKGYGIKAALMAISTLGLESRFFLELMLLAWDHYPDYPYIKGVRDKKVRETAESLFKRAWEGYDSAAAMYEALPKEEKKRIIRKLKRWAKSHSCIPCYAENGNLIIEERDDFYESKEYPNREAKRWFVLQAIDKFRLHLKLVPELILLRNDSLVPIREEADYMWDQEPELYVRAPEEIWKKILHEEEREELLELTKGWLRSINLRKKRVAAGVVSYFGVRDENVGSVLDAFLTIEDLQAHEKEDVKETRDLLIGGLLLWSQRTKSKGREPIEIIRERYGDLMNKIEERLESYYFAPLQRTLEDERIAVGVKMVQALGLWKEFFAELAVAGAFDGSDLKELFKQLSSEEQERVKAKIKDYIKKWRDSDWKKTSATLKVINDLGIQDLYARELVEILLEKRFHMGNVDILIIKTFEEWKERLKGKTLYNALSEGEDKELLAKLTANVRRHLMSKDVKEQKWGIQLALLFGMTEILQKDIINLINDLESLDIEKGKNVIRFIRSTSFKDLFEEKMREKIPKWLKEESKEGTVLKRHIELAIFAIKELGMGKVMLRDILEFLLSDKVEELYSGDLNNLREILFSVGKEVKEEGRRLIDVVREEDPKLADEIIKRIRAWAQEEKGGLRWTHYEIGATLIRSLGIEEEFLAEFVQFDRRDADVREDFLSWKDELLKKGKRPIDIIMEKEPKLAQELIEEVKKDIQSPITKTRDHGFRLTMDFDLQDWILPSLVEIAITREWEGKNSLRASVHETLVYWRDWHLSKNEEPLEVVKRENVELAKKILETIGSAETSNTTRALLIGELHLQKQFLRELIFLSFTTWAGEWAWKSHEELGKKSLKDIYMGLEGKEKDEIKNKVRRYLLSEKKEVRGLGSSMAKELGLEKELLPYELYAYGDKEEAREVYKQASKGERELIEENFRDVFMRVFKGELDKSYMRPVVEFIEESGIQEEFFPELALLWMIVRYGGWKTYGSEGVRVRVREALGERWAEEPKKLYSNMTKKEKERMALILGKMLKSKESIVRRGLELIERFELQDEFIGEIWVLSRFGSNSDIRRKASKIIETWKGDKSLYEKVVENLSKFQKPFSIEADKKAMLVLMMEALCLEG